MLTLNDYKILTSIIDKEDKTKGIIPSNATTKKEIMLLTGLSITKVNTALYSFIDKGYISLGLKHKNQNSYILTEKGMKKILEMKGIDIND